ncbi:MAG: hypothetical protein MZV65_35625 [Chromatiales bacterium]|nr:hypothetical protein [Chromatiales bacterium]
MRIASYRRAMSIAVTRGTTPEERALPFPGEPPDAGARPRALARRRRRCAARIVFRWLCQLRVAPYSYDWIDNLGRTSPGVLLPGLDALEAGQRFMTIFRLVAFAPGESITLETPPGGRARGSSARRASPTGVARMA